MNIVTALVLSAMFAAISAGVGVYVLRFRNSVTEMLGMMIGMTMGMMAGIAVGFYVGAATDMFVSNLVGVAAGIAFGAIFGRTGGLMGAMDGSMGGFMGGMMGGMLGVMVNISSFAVVVTTAVVTTICLVMYIALIVLVRRGAARKYAKDPVCDMLVDVATARLTSTWRGELVYFCAIGCKRDFDEDPEPYLVRSLRERNGGAVAFQP
jgi:YHS domain-containing protein